MAPHLELGKPPWSGWARPTHRIGVGELKAHEGIQVIGGHAWRDTEQPSDPGGSSNPKAPVSLQGTTTLQLPVQRETVYSAKAKKEHLYSATI